MRVRLITLLRKNAKMLKAGDIVLTGFPYAEKQRTKYRPALVISKKEFHEIFGICWVVMITSAENEPWDGDVALSASSKTGLSKPSIIRPSKLTTLDLAVVEKIGVVAPSILRQAVNSIHLHLAKID